MTEPRKTRYLWYIPHFDLYVVKAEKDEEPASPGEYIGPVSYSKLDEVTPVGSRKEEKAAE